MRLLRVKDRNCSAGKGKKPVVLAYRCGASCTKCREAKRSFPLGCESNVLVRWSSAWKVALRLIYRDAFVCEMGRIVVGIYGEIEKCYDSYLEPLLVRREMVKLVFDKNCCGHTYAVSMGAKDFHETNTPLSLFSCDGHLVRPGWNVRSWRVREKSASPPFWRQCTKQYRTCRIQDYVDELAQREVRKVAGSGCSVCLGCG